MGKKVLVFICFFRIFAQKYSCYPRTIGTALVYDKAIEFHLQFMINGMILILR